MTAIFKQLGLPEKPVFCAPLAGVSDAPFRLVSTLGQADLCYVEMISATALIHGSVRTLEMLYRHPQESILGVQVTARTADEMGEAVAILNKHPFETIDINMGCPVKKVVNSGCGSAILKDPERVYQTTKQAVANSDKPVSVKIRLGWDHSQLNFLEVGEAAQAGGAAWLTVHGRTRSDDYSQPVNLGAIALLKKNLRIPVIGNGNLFTQNDSLRMLEASATDGWMVSRGALGNPFIFREIKTGNTEVSLEEWFHAVQKHIDWQEEVYEDKPHAPVCMRKHLLWYLKGWPFAKPLRDKIVSLHSFSEMREEIAKFKQQLQTETILFRSNKINRNDAFTWDPKYQMDRQHDAAVFC